MGVGSGGSGGVGVGGGLQQGGQHQQGGPHLGYPQGGNDPAFYGYQRQQQYHTSELPSVQCAPRRKKVNVVLDKYKLYMNIA